MSSFPDPAGYSSGVPVSGAQALSADGVYTAGIPENDRSDRAGGAVGGLSLSVHARETVVASMPTVLPRLDAVASLMYTRLFDAHPELLDGVFSRSTARTGVQARAFSGAYGRFARSIIATSTEPRELVDQIAQRHAAAGVRAHRYARLRSFFAGALAQVIGDHVSGHRVVSWMEVYDLMAASLSRRESALYTQVGVRTHLTPWRVAARTAAGLYATTLELEPTAESHLSRPRPGQYISVRVTLADGRVQTRQYTLNDSTPSRRTFTVRRLDEGMVSPVLAGRTRAGQTLMISDPFGDVGALEGDGPLVLATAGIGCTPAAAILRALADSGSTREVLVAHADQSLRSWALRSRMEADVRALPNARLRVWLARREEGDDPGVAEVMDGRLDVVGLRARPGATVFLCGPVPFMDSMRLQLAVVGVPDSDIRYEAFGPDLWRERGEAPTQDRFR
ncbi:MAG: hemin transporter [Mycetocola sp.]